LITPSLRKNIYIFPVPFFSEKGVIDEDLITNKDLKYVFGGFCTQLNIFIKYTVMLKMI